MPTDTVKKCPCGSGRLYAECCEPLISGRLNAQTAEALMRSRYTAYAEHAIDYIINTCVHKGKDDIDYKSTREWSEQSVWLGLKILSLEKGGIAETEGIVEFEANYERDGFRDIHHEKAKFKRENSNPAGNWLYEEGHIIPRTIIRSSPKTGRNDPCPCGSGKKYKHCCNKK